MFFGGYYNDILAFFFILLFSLLLDINEENSTIIFIVCYGYTHASCVVLFVCTTYNPFFGL